MSYLGIDLGTSCCKAAILEHNGEIRAISRCSLKNLYPGEGQVEIDPNEMWRAVKKTLLELSPQCIDVEAIAISSIGETMIFLDDNDDPLSNGILYLDRRCQEILSEIDDKTDLMYLYSITGQPISQMYSLCRYMWIQKNRPQIIDRAKMVLMCGEYIGYMLTGERGLDPSTAAKTMLFDIRKRDWSQEIFKTFGVRLELFSPIKRTGTALGKLKKSIAEELNLPPSITVYVGAHDQCAAILGGGASLPGEVVSSQGSAEGQNMLLGTALDKAIEKKFKVEPYVVDGTYFTSQSQLSHGSCIRWFAENLEQDLSRACQANGKSVYQVLDDTCAADSGDVLFFPFLARVSGWENGMAKGPMGGFLGIDVSTDKHMMYRALLEGLSFESRYNLERLKEFGLPIKSITMVGGGSSSELFMQIKADILGCPLKTMHSAEMGIMGLGMICAVSRGHFSNYQECVPAFTRLKRFYIPSKDYGNKYFQYQMLSKTIKDIYRVI